MFLFLFIALSAVLNLFNLMIFLMGYLSDWFFKRNIFHFFIYSDLNLKAHFFVFYNQKLEIYERDYISLAWKNLIT